METVAQIQAPEFARTRLVHCRVPSRTASARLAIELIAAALHGPRHASHRSSVAVHAMKATFGIAPEVAERILDGRIQAVLHDRVLELDLPEDQAAQIALPLSVVPGCGSRAVRMQALLAQHLKEFAGVEFGSERHLAELMQDLLAWRRARESKTCDWGNSAPCGQMVPSDFAAD